MGFVHLDKIEIRQQAPVILQSAFHFGNEPSLYGSFVQFHVTDAGHCWRWRNGLSTRRKFARRNQFSRPGVEIRYFPSIYRAFLKAKEKINF
jgi:hypothetical protein